MIAARRAARRARRFSSVSLAVAVAAVLAPTPARAQIVNVQPLVGDDAKRGPSGSFDGALASQGGNTNVFTVSGQAVARYRWERSLAFVLASASYGESDGLRNTNKDLEHLRYRVAVHEPLELEVFGQHERDEFRRLAVRMLTGAGPRLHLSQWKPMDIGIGVAYMLEYEQLQHDGYPDAGETDVNQRLSSYVSVALSFGDPLKIGYTMYVQPRFDKPSDYRILSDLAFLSTVTPRWAIKIAASFAYDARPPIAVKSFDATRTASVSLTW